MSDVIISPNMNLPVPIVGQDAGPDWATNINSCMSQIDSHDHSSGKGIPITPNGISINGDLPFSGNNITLLKSIQFQAPTVQPTAVSPYLRALYSFGVDLWFNDGSGNQIQITSSGAVAGSPGSISSLTSPASASYNSGAAKFVWQSAANTPANMDFGFAILRNNAANAHGLSLKPPAAMASDIIQTLPAIPGSGTKFMSMDNTGAMGASWAVDGSTIEVNTNVVQVPDGGITTTQLAALVSEVSVSLGSKTTSSTSYVTVDNAGVTIAASGNRPLFIGVYNDDATNAGAVAISASANSCEGFMAIFEDSTVIAVNEMFAQAVGASAVQYNFPLNFFTIRNVSAGTYSYTLKIKATSGSAISMVNARIIAYEL